MTEDHDQPPAAPIRPESTARSPAGNRAAVASLRLGGGSVLLALLTLLRFGSPVNLRTDLDLIFASGSAAMGMTGLVAAAALLCGIIGRNSERWPRALFGTLLAFLALCPIVAIATSVGPGGPR